MSVENRKTILLVEDEAIIAIAQKMTLEKYGYNVITVNSGERAYDIIKGNNDIDLILMDIDLGEGIDGPETAKIILTEREIPVVFLSSHTEPEVVEKTEKITSYGYVVKNSGITVLDASLKMAFKLFEAKKRIVESEATVRKKLDTILEPDEDISSLSLEDIIDYHTLQNMMEDFNRINKIGGSAILDISGKVLVAAGWQDICTKFHRVNPETCKNCLESDVNLASGVAFGTSRAYKCKNNMWDMVTPIVVGGRHVGNIYLGQFLYDDETPNYEVFRGQARQYGFNESEYLKALDSVPRMSREMAEVVMSFFAKFADMISSLSYSKIKLSRALSQKDMALYQLAESESRQNAMISNISDVVSIISADGIMKFNSPNIEKWFGWLPEEIEGTVCWSKVHPDDLERIQKEFYALLEKKSSSVKVGFRYSCKDGSYKPVELTAANLTYDPHIKGVLLNFHDITERRVSEEALLRIEDRYKKAQKLGHVGNWEYNLQTSHFWGSDEAKRIYGFDPMQSDFSTDEVEKCIPERERVHQALIDLIRDEKEYNLEFEIHPRNGDEPKFIWSTAELQKDENGNPLIVTGVIQDITERKKLEANLKSANGELMSVNEELNAAIEEMEAGNEELAAAIEELYSKDKALTSEKVFTEALLESIPGYLYVYDDKGKLVKWNRKHEEMTGYSAEELSHMTMDKWFEGEDALRVAAAVEEVFKTGYGEVEANLLTKSGGKLLIRSNGVPLTIDGKTYFTGVGIDITESKRAEDALRKSQMLLKSSIESPKDIIILSIDNQYRYLYFNDYHKTVMSAAYGIDVEVGMNLLDCITHDEDRRKAEINYGRALAGEGHITVEEYGELNRLYYETRYNPIVNDKNEVIGATAFSANVTEKKRDEEKINSLLHEKELLLREVHHRIKNNMNTVYGLLMLQAESIKEPSAVSALEDAAGRVKTMMVLYDKLYQSEDFKAISSVKYFPFLIDQIAANFSDRKLVKVVKNIEDFILDAKHLQPLGIIINELLTNIMKYAFTGRDDGVVTVSASLNKNRVCLEIHDNGNGLPESVSFENSTGFGLQLVEMLSEQIGGSIRIERGGGTKFILEFDV